MDKHALRTTILAKRRSLTPGEVARASEAALGRLRGLDAWPAAREVLLYAAFAGEIDALLLLDELWAAGVRTLLPRCRPGEPGRLDVTCLNCLEELIPGAYGIPEPDPGRCPTLTDFAPDIALIPAVAFDRAGNRLGFGQGYYDRLLAKPALSRTLLIGLAHPFQVLDRLPRDPWDRPVQIIVTPEELICP